MHRLTLVNLIIGSLLAGGAIFAQRSPPVKPASTAKPVAAPTPTDKARADAFIAKIKERNTNFDCQDLSQKTLKGLALSAYGAVFVSKAAKDIPTCLFTTKDAVDTYQKKIKDDTKSKLEGLLFHLVPDAARVLENVFKKAEGYKKIARLDNNTTKNPRNELNGDWAMRKLEDTQHNWINYDDSGEAGLTPAEISAELISDPDIQVRLKPEKMFLAAIPGASQHHFGLAIDINNGSQIRGTNRTIPDAGNTYDKVLRENGWWRTVPTDRQHFTYLGYTTEDELKANLLRKITCYGIVYWVPDLTGIYQNPHIETLLNSPVKKNSEEKICSWD